MQPVATQQLMTARLVLTPLAESDAAVMVEVLADHRLYTFTGGEPPDLEELTKRYRFQVAGPPDRRGAWHNWIVRLGPSDEPVGFVQATVEAGTADVAWVIGAEYQGRGIASEAARAMCEWLVGIGVHHFAAHIHPDHAASQRVAAKLGFASTAEIDGDGEVIWTATGPE